MWKVVLPDTLSTVKTYRDLTFPSYRYYFNPTRDGIDDRKYELFTIDRLVFHTVVTWKVMT